MNYQIKSIDTVPGIDPYHMSTGKPTHTLLKIHEDGDICVSQEYDDHATPSDEWHWRTLTFSLAHVDEKELREYLTNNNLVERIVNGHSVEWNGHNMVGVLTDDAQSAADDLQEELEELLPHYALWEADEWLGQCTPTEVGISSETSDEEIEEIAKDIIRSADDYDGLMVVLDGVEEYLTQLRDELRDDES